MSEVIREALEPGPDCLPLEDLAGALSGTEGDARINARRHLENCPRCRAAYLVQSDFEGATPRPDEEAVVEWIVRRMGNPIPEPQPAPRIRTGFLSWLWTPSLLAGAAAAAILLAIGIGVVDRNFSKPAPASTGDAVFRSAAIQTLSPVGDIRDVPGEFRWSSAVAAHTFVVTVMEVDRTVVQRVTVQGTSVSIPEIRTLLQPGRTLLWSVQALDESGNVIQDSGATRFRLVEPRPAANN